MNFLHLTYNMLAAGLTPVALPAAWCHARRTEETRTALAQRLGYARHRPTPVVSGNPRVWVHAVSVGEVKAAEAIVSALVQTVDGIAILLTTTTATGQRYARAQFDRSVTVCYAPVDLWWVTGRFLRTYRPHMLICMETEIWPNWIVRAHQAGMRTVFLNGRISNRSIRAYMRIRPLLRPVLGRVDAFSMISPGDAQRITALGAPAERVQVNGNVKMDIRSGDRDVAAVHDLRRLFAVEEHTPVFIGGSVRGAEVEMLLEVYLRLAERIAGLLFVIAPRHIEKTPQIVERARAMGIAWQRRTELGEAGAVRRAPLVILDTIGELRHLYGIASVVFGGASLVPLGGQNVLEAAVWAKPVLFGPYMDDFMDARNLLEGCGGGREVRNAAELVQRAAHLLTHPDQARRMGRLARSAVLANQGAADRHAAVAVRLLRTRADA